MRMKQASLKQNSVVFYTNLKSSLVYFLSKGFLVFCVYSIVWKRNVCGITQLHVLCLFFCFVNEFYS